MNKIFQYTLLQYVHSQVLSERLNLGVLFYFPTSNRFYFRAFERIKKFRSLYKSYPESAVQEYLSSFERASYGLSDKVKSEKIESFKTYISKYFLTEESASLQFTEIKSGVLYTDDPEKIVNDYYSLLCSELGSKATFVKQINKAPLQKLKSLLELKLPNYKKYIQTKGTEIRVEKVIFKPDLIWVNGSTNVVKGVNFSKSEESIIDTALLLNKKLDSLQSKSIINNYRFDLLVQKPDDEKLIKPFQDAIEILEEIKVPKRIVTEENLEDYTNGAVRELLSH